MIPLKKVHIKSHPLSTFCFFVCVCIGRFTKREKNNYIFKSIQRKRELFYLFYLFFFPPFPSETVCKHTGIPFFNCAVFFPLLFKIRFSRQALCLVVCRQIALGFFSFQPVFFKKTSREQSGDVSLFICFSFNQPFLSLAFILLFKNLKGDTKALLFFFTSNQIQLFLK